MYAAKVTMGNVVLGMPGGFEAEWHGIPAEGGVFIEVGHIGQVGGDYDTDIVIHTYWYLILDVEPVLPGLAPEENEALWAEVYALDKSYGLPVYWYSRQLYTTNGPVVIEWEPQERKTTTEALAVALERDRPVMALLREARQKAGGGLFVMPQDEPDEPLPLALWLGVKTAELL